MGGENLEKQVQELAELARENKNVDVSKLMGEAFVRHEENTITPKQRRWAYAFSFLFAPLGLFVAIYYYFSGKDDGKKTALICVLITVLVVGAFLAIFNMILSSANVTPDQLQQTPQLLNSLLQQ